MATLPPVRVREVEDWLLTDGGNRDWLHDRDQRDVLGMVVMGWTDLSHRTTMVNLDQLGLAVSKWLRGFRHPTEERNLRGDDFVP